MAIASETHAPGPPPGFNPISQEFLNDPQRWLALARHESPVFFAPDFGLWVLTRFDDIDRALGDWETFSSASLAMVPVPDEYADRVPPGFFATGALVSQDPPEHTQRRKLINRGFARGQMARMAEPIERICHELIDGFVADGRCDLMTQYCYEVSLRSIVCLMGLPQDDLPRLRQLAEDQGAVVSDTIKPLEHDERLERWERIVQARGYLTAVVEARRQAPAEDLVSLMVTATDDDGRPRLTADEIVTHLTELIFAGTDTTANLMASVVRLLDGDPDTREELQADPSLWPAALEEGLRLRPGANGIFRITTRDVELRGVTIPRGSVVWLALGSGNQDEARFADPGAFDVHRADAGGHIGFGKGRHFCMGAPLTRVEAPIGMRVLYERLPALRVDPNQSYEYDPVLVVVTLKHLYVNW